MGFSFLLNSILLSLIVELLSNFRVCCSCWKLLLAVLLLANFGNVSSSVGFPVLSLYGLDFCPINFNALHHCSCCNGLRRIRLPSELWWYSGCEIFKLCYKKELKSSQKVSLRLLEIGSFAFSCVAVLVNSLLIRLKFLWYKRWLLQGVQAISTLAPLCIMPVFEWIFVCKFYAAI